MREIVTKPNLEDAGENAKRRALFFIRHLALWKELPEGTEWYEVEVREPDLAQIRVFPRAQWLNLARGNFSITEVAERMRTRQSVEESPFLSKIEGIRARLQQEDDGLGAVLLIGVNENDPLTILDGNHRHGGGHVGVAKKSAKASLPLRTVAQDEGVLLVQHQPRDSFSLWEKRLEARSP